MYGFYGGRMATVVVNTINYIRYLIKKEFNKEGI